MPRPKPTRIEGQFIPHRRDLLESPAWRSLSPAARRILDRLELEDMYEGGGENGNLICTYDQMAEYGVRRQSIKAAIAELVAVGMVEVTHKGRGGNAVYRDASRYRITYLRTGKGSRAQSPTDEWRRFNPPDQGRRSASVEVDPTRAVP